MNMVELHYRCRECGTEWTDMKDEKRDAFFLSLFVRNPGAVQTAICDRCAVEYQRRQEDEQKQKWYTDMLEESGMPQWCVGVKTANTEIVEALQNAEEKHVYVCGNRGIGKTSSACIAAKKQMWAKQKSVKFHDFATLLMEYSMACRGRDANPKGFLRNAFDADIVILDDYGKKRFTENACELMWFLFNGIYTQSLRCRLWITAESPLSASEGEYADKDIGGAITSRIDRMKNAGSMAVLDFTRVRGLASV